jgi:hypothetical protein
MIPKNGGLKYFDTKEELEGLLAQKDFKKIEE